MVITTFGVCLNVTWHRPDSTMLFFSHDVNWCVIVTKLTLVQFGAGQLGGRRVVRHSDYWLRDTVWVVDVSLWFRGRRHWIVNVSWMQSFVSLVFNSWWTIICIWSNSKFWAIMSEYKIRFLDSVFFWFLYFS